MGCTHSVVSGTTVPGTSQDDAADGKFFENFDRAHFGGGQEEFLDGITAVYVAPVPQLRLFDDALSVA